MATKRTKIGPRKISRLTPEWARTYAETGEVPAYGTDDHDAWCGWYFFDEEVAGLPPSRSHEGRALIARERR